jgi:transcriptional regulator with XRE-family HTH domain
MGKLYWWSDYHEFSPGEGILPHTGEVIAYYRQRRGFKTQADLAIAAGVLPRSVTDWETKPMLRDPERRIFLAKLLKIPPALLGLDWRLIVYEDNTGTCSNSIGHTEEIWLEDSYYHYEDTLELAWSAFYGGNRAGLAERFARRLQKLEKLVKDISGPNREAWLEMLCRYYQFSMSFTQHQGTGKIFKQKAIHQAKLAIQIATEIQDDELLAIALSRLSKNYLTYREPELARDAAMRAMQYVEGLRNLSKGNLLLLVAENHSHPAAHDAALAAQVRKWQDRAITLVYKGNIEPDGSFFYLNRAAVHHERAKTLLEFALARPNEKSLLDDAHGEMKLAWDALTPDLVEWRMYFFITEARLYMAERDLEGSARLGLDALQVARLLQSMKGESQVRGLYQDLRGLDERNPYVCNLGVQLGIF